jgi:predicted DNA-binding protein YlxM (UPF0122 family)
LGEFPIRIKTRNYSKRKKTITRTFRIKDDWDIILHEEAERQNISVNALIDKILRRFALFDRYTDRLNILNLPNRTFKEIIQFIPEEKLTEEGQKHGSLDAVDFFNSLGYPRDYNTFTYLITEHFGSPKFARWFQCFHHPLETQDLFHLQHNLGRKWSIFLNSYLRTILKTITNTKVESQIYDYAVTLKVSRPQITERKKKSHLLKD